MIIDAVLARMKCGWRYGNINVNIASLRKELEGLKVTDLREKAKVTQSFIQND